MILGLAGAAGSGKSAAAAYLAERHGFVRTRFAGPLKAMLRGYLTHVGVEPAMIERMIEGDLKETPADELDGATPRYIMQTLGTDWARETISETYWTNAWRAHALRLVRAGQTRIVVEDCRFPNEVSTIRGAYGAVIGIKRPGAENPAAGHKSEAQSLELDCSIWNDGPLSILHARLDGIVSRYSGATHEKAPSV